MMKIEVWRGQKTLRFLYFRYKDSSYFYLFNLSICILVSLILIFQVVIPQLQNWFSIRDEEAVTLQKIKILRENISFMSELNKDLLEKNRRLANLALPVEKDFGVIIDAVTMAAAKSGVSIDDFSFNLGLVSSISGEIKIESKSDDSTMTKLSLYLNGDVDKIKNFITQIGEKLPISQIELVDIISDDVYISLLFYSKPYEKPLILEDKPINPLSAENNNVFSKLSRWDDGNSSDENQVVNPSLAVPLF